MALFTKKALSRFYGGEDVKDPIVLKWFGFLEEAVPSIRTFSVSINPPNIAANTTGIATATVSGVLAAESYVVEISKPTHTTGLGIVNARVSADNTIEITFMNSTGAGINVGAETYIGSITQL